MTQAEIEEIQDAIDALEAQRDALGDHVVETAIRPLREKLEALRQEAVSEERKRISVLFADVVGFTALSENLDPEDVTAIMNRLFDVLTTAVTRFGGTVDKYSGDAVMALFGAPQALENHEEMAVRAALAMQEAAAAYSERLAAERDLRLQLRIGVNTGPVLAALVGGMDRKRYTVMGDTVNLASRLEHASLPGRVLISAATARPLHAIFSFEPPQQITVKGKTEPITVYLVQGERAERGRVRGVAGLHAPMVGRQLELEKLQAAYAQALSQQRWRVAAVSGAAGIGKTRLRREFIAWVMETYPQTRLLAARSYLHTRNTPYHLAASLVRALFNVGEDVELSAAVARLREGLETMLAPSGKEEGRLLVGSLAAVLGFSLPDDPLSRLDPQQRRDRIFLTLEQVLLAASAAAPLLIVLEDLHWADNLSLAFLERLAQTLENADDEERAALLLVVGRPPQRARADGEGADWSGLLAQIEELPHTRLDLRPLDGAEAQTLVEALLDQRLPAGLLRIVTEHAQGNPLFVEEILRAFIEDGTLTGSAASGWQLTRAVSDLHVPATVQDLLTARIDRLSLAQKVIVQHAAIIGRTFWQRLLADVLESSGRKDAASDVEAILVQLQARQFVVRLNESQIADDWEWVFAHVLIQEVAYSAVPRKVRRRVHRQVGRRLEAAVEAGAGGRAPALLPLVAFHYERGDEPAKAIRFLRRAGELAAAQYANADAVDYFTRALKLLDEVEEMPAGAPPAAEQRYDLLLGRENVYHLVGEREGQAADLARLKELLPRIEGPRPPAEVALRYARYYDAVSDFPAAIEVAREAVAHGHAVQMAEYAFEGQIAWARALWRQGKFEEARRRLKEALALARDRGDAAGEATSLHHLGTIAAMLGENEEARRNLEQALSIRRTLDDRRNVVSTLANLGHVFIRIGDLATAKAYCEQVLATSRTIGHRQFEASALTNLATIHHALGALDTARYFHEQALALFQALDDPRGQSIAANNLGLVHVDLENFAMARYYCRQALKLKREIGDRRGEGYSLTYLGMALEGLGELEVAVAAYQEALDLRREIGQDAYAMDDLAGLARVALRRDEEAGALAHAEEILTWIAENGVEGIEYPVRVYLTIANVLEAAGRRERAADVLDEAYRFLQRRAAQISDAEVRRAFLEHVPLHHRLRERIDAVSSSA